MKRGRIVMTFFVLLFLLIIFYFITDRITRHTGFFALELLEVFEGHDVAQCLEKHELILFINEKNAAETRETLQRQEYSEYMKIFNCARNNDECTRREISVFPTLIIDGHLFEGAIDSSQLLKETDC